MEITKSQLPSRGITYNNTPDTIHINADSIAFLKLVSASTSTGQTSYMLDAIKLATGITDTLTMGDYYFLAALLLTQIKEIDWSWKCKASVVEFTSCAIEYSRMFEDDGCKVIDWGSDDYSFNVRTNSTQEHAKLLEKYKGMGLFGKENNVVGRLVTCGHDIKSNLTAEDILSNAVYLNMPEPNIYVLPDATLIDEYHELMKDPTLVKLLPAVSCLPLAEFGPTLKSKLDALRFRTDAITIFNEASEFANNTKHGLKKVLTKPCPECLALNARSYAFTPEQFF